MSYLILAAFGCMTGVTTVLFGFGGGFVVVPLLYRLLIASHSPGEPAYQQAMQIAVATSTAVMVISASLATAKQRRAGNLVEGYLWPLAGYIALGAVAGALLAGALDGTVLRIAFIVYLAVTIADCLLRRGFMQDAQPRNRTVKHPLPKGLAIGAIATFLGVGGSVMTVPLLRRSGLSMGHATALANPLSIPVALVGSLTYLLIGEADSVALKGHFLGYIYLPALGLLTAGAWAGVRLASPFAGKIADRLHARIYVLLLVLVLITMIAG